MHKQIEQHESNCEKRRAAGLSRITTDLSDTGSVEAGAVWALRCKQSLQGMICYFARIFRVEALYSAFVHAHTMGGGFHDQMLGLACRCSYTPRNPDWGQLWTSDPPVFS
jgi:hypothetical protein